MGVEGDSRILSSANVKRRSPASQTAVASLTEHESVINQSVWGSRNGMLHPALCSAPEIAATTSSSYRSQMLHRRRLLLALDSPRASPTLRGGLASREPHRTAESISGRGSSICKSSLARLQTAFR